MKSLVTWFNVANIAKAIIVYSAIFQCVNITNYIKLRL